MPTTRTFHASQWRARFHAALSATTLSTQDVTHEHALVPASGLQPHTAVKKGPAAPGGVGDTRPIPPNVPDGLPRHVKPTLAAIHRLAHDVRTIREQDMASVVTFHLPQELLAAHLGVHPVTLWRHLGILDKAGLVVVRPHFTNSKGTTRVDGSVWAVAMKDGVKATLTHADLVHQYRDLDADREAGRTAWALVKTSGKNLQTEEGFLELRNWAVGNSLRSPVVSDGCTEGMDVVWNLENLALVPAAGRGDAVTAAATALSSLLNDTHSRRFYAALLWRALQATHGGLSPLRTLSHVLTRVKVDIEEGFARRPGALLVSRLREGGWLDATLAFSECQPRLL